MGSQWRGVPACPGYWVSRDGRVRYGEGKEHKQKENRAGWLVVVVRGWVASGHLQKRVWEVHRLVGLVWKGIDGPVGHRDGDHRNNAARNLVKAASEREAKRMSGRLRYVVGKRNGAKLKPAEVRRMRKLRENGWSLVDLAEKFGVSHQAVSKICLGKMWEGVE